jgi:two-component system sensor histidine kinase CreC
MRLGTRIFLCYLLIFALCFYYPINWIVNSLITRYLEGVEDPLVDQANVLAAIVGVEIEERLFDPELFYRAFDNVYSRSLYAQIYSLPKTEVDMQVYITDIAGRVIFDSKHRDYEGADYSTWRDVRLTLQGEYGARTSRNTPDDPDSSVLFVAAPIMVAGHLVGVLSVGKPTTNIKTFLQNARPQIIQVGAISAGVAILLSYIVSFWLTRPIKRLTQYADAIRQGNRMEFPTLDRSEIGEMGKAFQKMQEALEGKRYVEQYIQNLTHEIKSPLSAIRGAAELLEEDVPSEQRDRFLSNIRDEANRIQKIIDRMLELSALENLKNLETTEKISFTSLIDTVLESKGPIISKKKLDVAVQIPENIIVRGDSFLLHQAISNVLQNAIDFSPVGGQIDLISLVDEHQLQLMVEDQGIGIPHYATDKIFDKFFSLQRPDSGKKSTGLGLNFVKEVAMLHKGDITLENHPEKGVRATLTLPL